MTGPVLLFDGACGLCVTSVRFILARERDHDLQFAPLAGQTAATLLSAHPELATIDSLVLVTAGHVRVRSAAALAVASHLRWPWPLLRLALVIPRPLRDGLYDLVARHRHRLVRPAPFTPPPNTASRFLP